MFLEQLIGFLFLLLFLFLSHQIDFLWCLAFWWSGVWDPRSMWLCPHPAINLIWDNSRWPVNFHVGQSGTCPSSFPCFLPRQTHEVPGRHSSWGGGTFVQWSIGDSSFYPLKWIISKTMTLAQTPEPLSQVSDTAKAWGKYRATKEKLFGNELGNHWTSFPHFTGEETMTPGCVLLHNSRAPAQTLAPHSSTWSLAPKEPEDSRTGRESMKEGQHIALSKHPPQQQASNWWYFPAEAEREHANFSLQQSGSGSTPLLRLVLHYGNGSAFT